VSIVYAVIVDIFLLPVRDYYYYYYNYYYMTQFYDAGPLYMNRHFKSFVNTSIQPVIFITQKLLHKITYRKLVSFVFEHITAKRGKIKFFRERLC
jgi:hypothetical protein